MNHEKLYNQSVRRLKLKSYANFFLLYRFAWL